jgi:hypothetical protein
MLSWPAPEASPSVRSPRSSTESSFRGRSAGTVCWTSATRMRGGTGLLHATTWLRMTTSSSGRWRTRSSGRISPGVCGSVRPAGDLLRRQRSKRRSRSARICIPSCSDRRVGPRGHGSRLPSERSTRRPFSSSTRPSHAGASSPPTRCACHSWRSSGRPQPCSRPVTGASCVPVGNRLRLAVPRPGGRGDGARWRCAATGRKPVGSRSDTVAADPPVFADLPGRSPDTRGGPVSSALP